MPDLLPSGVYPASVTPFDENGAVDDRSVLRLLAYFESAGCQGVVLAGTNGEGPSLSAFEKRDLLRVANSGRGKLRVILGVATPSLTEANWLCSQAGKNGADAVLLMPPSYFRRATESGVEEWMTTVVSASPVPVIVYNYPKMTGVTLSAALVGRLAGHPNVVGVKDSSGDVLNLVAFRAVVPPGKSLFVGDETILMEALAEAWTGTISGAANVVPQWLVRVVSQWAVGDEPGAGISFSLIEPVLRAVLQLAQPEGNKSVLHSLGIITTPNPRLPLQALQAPELLSLLSERLGIDGRAVGS